MYLDYSATTPSDRRVVSYFKKVNKKFYANPNSLHTPGSNANKFVLKCQENILSYLDLKEKDVIFTSGASEANNLAIKGLALKHDKQGKKIITTNFEHPSVTAPISWLQKQGYEVEIVKCDSHGRVDLKDLKSKLDENVLLVSIGAVNSEIGILQPIDEIKKILKKYPEIYFHCDVTQCIGKINFDFSEPDLISFSAHKFYGINGVGALI